VKELFEEEKVRLVALPEVSYSNIETPEGRIDRYATVMVDKNRYSVPTRYVGLKVKVVMSIEGVEIFRDGSRIASHRRLYGNNKWVLDPDHYLELIQQRPGAFDSARPIRQWRSRWPASLEQLLGRFRHSQGETKGIKDFINVLMLYRDSQAAAVEAAVAEALKAGISSSQAVAYLVKHAAHGDDRPQALTSWPALPPADVSIYGQLGGVL
jgi:hypothetical protein